MKSYIILIIFLSSITNLCLGGWVDQSEPTKQCPDPVTYGITNGGWSYVTDAHSPSASATSRSLDRAVPASNTRKSACVYSDGKAIVSNNTTCRGMREVLVVVPGGPYRHKRHTCIDTYQGYRVTSKQISYSGYKEITFAKAHEYVSEKCKEWNLRPSTASVDSSLRDMTVNETDGNVTWVISCYGARERQPSSESAISNFQN